MKIEGKTYRTIWFENNIVKIIDQTKLPHQFVIKDLKTVKDSINAIKKFNLYNSVSYVSTGRGAMLSYLEGKELPGVSVLKSFSE